MYQVDVLEYNRNRASGNFMEFEPICTCDNLKQVYEILKLYIGKTTRVLSNNCVLCFINGTDFQIEWFKENYIDNIKIL